MQEAAGTGAFIHLKTVIKMRILLSSLMGLALLSQGNYAPAQTGAARTKGLEELFAYHIRMGPPGIDESNDSNEKERHVLLKTSCEKILKGGGQFTFINNRNGRVKLQLRGVYTQGSMLYFLLRLNNRSPIDYEIDQIRFSVVDQPGRGQPLIGHGELFPLYQYDSSGLILGYSRQLNVVVLPRFTLPRGKRLLIEVLEKDGGRHLQINTGNFLLEKARIL